MVRKFKHNQTGWVAIQDGSNQRILLLYPSENSTCLIGSIYLRFLTDCENWQEITQDPILVTEDGYKLHDKNEQIWFVFSGWPDDDFELDKRSINQTCNLEKQCVFYKKENAEAYIERHKPRYNIKDLMFLRQEVKNAFSWYWTEQEIKDAILKTIIHLKNSKND